MSTRSRDAQLLGRLLSEHTGIPVYVVYYGPARDHHGGWHVTWCDGPTQATMRDLVGKVAEAHSVRFPLRGYTRNSTDLAEAAALLLWLDTIPDHAVDVGSVAAARAYDVQDHPEVADEPTLSRARALLSLSPAGTLELGTLDQVRQRARRDGWAGVLEWLDGITAAAEDPGVVSLDAARRRREQG